MLAVCVQSGMTIEKALRYIADNTYAINPNIATLFDRAMLKTEVNGINAALEQLYEEVPGTEVRMLCSTLQQSIKYGSSIYQVLIDLSKEMRELHAAAYGREGGQPVSKNDVADDRFHYVSTAGYRCGARHYRDGVNMVKLISLTALLALFVLCGCQNQTGSGGELNDSQREYNSQ